MRSRVVVLERGLNNTSFRKLAEVLGISKNRVREVYMKALMCIVGRYNDLEPLEIVRSGIK